MRNFKIATLLAAASAMLAPLVAKADATADLATVSAAGVAQIGAVSGISTTYAVPLFGLTVVGVGIAIGMKYLKKGKGAA